MRDTITGLIIGALLAYATLGTPTQASFVPTIVRSVQRGTITIPDSDADGVATATLATTLTSVSKTLCTLDGFSGGNTQASTSHVGTARIALTNTTTITGRGTTPGVGVFDEELINYTCIEFY